MERKAVPVILIFVFIVALVGYWVLVPHYRYEVEAKWVHDYTGSGVENLAVIDVDRDGNLEVVVGTAIGVFVLDTYGNVKYPSYSYRFPGVWYQLTHPWSIKVDLDGDGKEETLGGTYCDQYYPIKGNVYSFDSQGRLKWNYTATGGVPSPATIADIHGDGNLEIVFGTRLSKYQGYVECIDIHGKFLWKYETGGVMHSPIVVDIDGDGKTEILAGSHLYYSGYVYCLKVKKERTWF